MTDFDTPEGRLALIERVGVDEYNRLHREHQAQQVITTWNGYPIREIYSMRFGRLFSVDGTGNAYATIEAAIAYAQTLPVRT